MINNINENEYSAIIDTLKNITDVVAVLTTKINLLEDEINKININNSLINEKIKNIKVSSNTKNLELESEDDEKINKQSSYNDYTTNNKTETEFITEPTTIRETEIERIKKNKAIQLVDKLIQKKKELGNNEDNNENLKNNNEENNNVNNLNKQNIITKRKNNFIRRF